jgi:hypothetical protein
MKQIFKLKDSFYDGVDYVENSFVVDNITTTEAPLQPDTILSLNSVARLEKGQWINDSSVEAKKRGKELFPMLAALQLKVVEQPSSTDPAKSKVPAKDTENSK